MFEKKYEITLEANTRAELYAKVSEQFPNVADFDAAVRSTSAESIKRVRITHGQATVALDSGREVQLSGKLLHMGSYSPEPLEGCGVGELVVDFKDDSYAARFYLSGGRVLDFILRKDGNKQHIWMQSGESGELSVIDAELESDEDLMELIQNYA